jgi:hypothetical protein
MARVLSRSIPVHKKLHSIAVYDSLAVSDRQRVTRDFGADGDKAALQRRIVGLRGRVHPFQVGRNTCPLRLPLYRRWRQAKLGSDALVLHIVRRARAALLTQGESRPGAG